ncbi:MAG: sensor domain-containing diguanylate cyclase [Clostridia bacterium]|nr:sensor domain-containing diguanylate cyclase [Clostridia bacterium]
MCAQKHADGKLLQALAELAREFRELSDPDEIRQTAAHAVRDALDYESCAVGFSEDGGAVRLAFSGSWPEASGRLLVPNPSDSRTLTYCVSHGSSILLGHAAGERLEPTCPGAKSEVCAPMLGGKSVVGVVIGSDSREGVFGDEELGVHQSVADFLGILIEGKSLAARLRRALETDPQTGLYNRKHLAKRINEEISRVNRGGGGQFALLFFGVLGMGEINASYGHEMGDAVLEMVARALKGDSRASDVPARFGDDEFTILLPGADASRAQMAANRISRQVRAVAVSSSTGRIQAPELQWWVVTYPADGSTCDELLAARDRFGAR